MDTIILPLLLWWDRHTQRIFDELRLPSTNFCSVNCRKLTGRSFSAHLGAMVKGCKQLD